MSSTGTNSHGLAIRLGPWINWEKGPIWGSQVTLSSLNAQILASFLGIFVTLVGVQLWQIISFVIHQLRSRDGSSDGMGLAQSMNRHYIDSQLPWVVIAMVYAVGFAIISVFTASEIVKAPGNARLMKSENCGLFNQSRHDVLTTDHWGRDRLQDAFAAAQYARSCYPGNDTTSTVTCDNYAQPFLPFTTTHVDCPFQPSECRDNNRTSFQLDTGLLDSHVHLGINSPKKERIQFRNPYGGANGDRIVIVDMGPLSSLNYTYDYNTHRLIDSIDYTLQTTMSFLGQDALWTPVPALNRTDADVSLVALAANSIGYLTPCDDPIFGAHDYHHLVTDDGESNDFWDPDQILTSMACAEQFQYCNPTNGRCTDLTGIFEAGTQSYGLSVSTAQAHALLRVGDATLYSNIFQSINGRGASALLASSLVNNLQSYYLPPNQWELEIAGWYTTALARLQMDIQSYASRSSSDNITAPASNDRIGQRMCHNQMTKNTLGTVSCSLLGLAFVICLGFVIVVLGFLIEPITSFVQRRTGWGLQRYHDWVLNDKLQLHRMALEARGVGPWAKTSERVPVTERGVSFRGWGKEDLEDGTVTSEDVDHSQPEETMGSAETKPFMASEAQETRYYHAPTLKVEEVR
ncbi:MAG: hypothetical protein Q9162_001171 [Coniocarpon cinnabarinum]